MYRERRTPQQMGSASLTIFEVVNGFSGKDFHCLKKFMEKSYCIVVAPVLD